MKKLKTTFKYISILILAIAFIGCDEEDTVLPEVVAGFTYTVDSDTRTVTFINTSENAHKYDWDLGDNTTTTLINPVKTYGIGSYTIVLQAKNVAGDTDTFEDTIVFLDQEVPLITLIGDEVINVTLGDVFTDPGATALDEVDGNITANIVVGGDTVDTNTEGTYVITYNVSDAQGNAAEEVERTVNVSTISCDDETEETLTSTGLNITFLTDPAIAGGVVVTQDNVTYEYANNPDPSADLNTSCKVGKITKSGVESWDNLQIDFANKFTFTDGSNFTVKVFSPVAGYKVSIKLEDKSTSGSVFKTEVHSETATTKTNEWEELTIPFEAVDSGLYDKMVIFFDIENPANTNTYYIDDLKLNLGSGSGGGGACAAESTEDSTAAGLNLTFMSNLSSTIATEEGLALAWSDNPDIDNGVNSTCKVGQVTKGGSSDWDHARIEFTNKIDLSANGGFKMKVFSENPGSNILVKLEDSNNANGPSEIGVNTTKTNEWEELTFDFGAGDTDKYDKIILFFDAGKTNTNTYYFDDLKLFARSTGGGGGTGGGSTGQYSLDQAIDFESDGFGGQWTWNVFENADNPPLEFVANPNASGINTSSQVAKIIARKDGAPWVGTETAHGEMNLNWDLSASNAIIKIMVYKTVISDVGIKLVNPAGGAQAEIKVANTKVNEWEELTFDFSSRIGNGLDGSSNIDQIVVFPDFSDPRPSETVTYFDNITFN